MTDSSQNAAFFPRTSPGAASGMDSGTVVSRSNDAFLVASGQGVIRATRAAGCLLEPDVQDRVLLAVLADGSAWVLSVLERNTGQEPHTAATIRLPDHSVLAADTLNLAARDLRCDAENLTLKADEVGIEGTRVQVKGSLLCLGGKLLSQTFEAMHTVAKHSSEHILHVKKRYTELRERVYGLADRKAGRMRLESEESLRIRAAQADIKAETVLDLDAEHIRLG